jgi:hypothetical protein
MLGKQDGWHFLVNMKFDIKHIKGKENKVVDALNRRVHAMHVTTINVCKYEWRNKILNIVTLDEHYLQSKEGLQ